MWRVIGADRVDRAVAQPLDQRLDISAGAERRIDLRVRIARRTPRELVALPVEPPIARDPLVGEGEVMRRDLGGDARPARLGLADQRDAARRRRVAGEEPAPGRGGQGQIARQDRLLGDSGAAGDTEPVGDRPRVHRPAAHQGWLLAVDHNRAIERLARSERDLHRIGRTGRFAIIGEADRPRRRERRKIDRLGERPARA